jgi:prevent-host-death family protein
MDVPITEAKMHLTDLVRRAQAGEDIVLTRFGMPVVRLTPVATKSTPASRRAQPK